MKRYGAVNNRVTITRQITIRTKLLDANVDTIRALATSASGMKPTGGMKGPLALQLTENE